MVGDMAFEGAQRLAHRWRRRRFVGEQRPQRSPANRGTAAIPEGVPRAAPSHTVAGVFRSTGVGCSAVQGWPH